MKFIKQLAAVAAVLSAAPAFAASPVTLDFEGTSSFASIAEYYNGGTDSAGVSGTNDGVSFGLSALSLSNDVLGPYYSNAPSSNGVMFVADAADASLTYNAGFTNLSFYYAASSDAVLNIYAAEGSLIKTLTLAANTDATYSTWSLVNVSLAGVGTKIDLSGSVGSVAYDNITISAVPEASSYAMVLAGLGVVGMVARRRKQA